MLLRLVVVLLPLTLICGGLSADELPARKAAPGAAGADAPKVTEGLKGAERTAPAPAASPASDRSLPATTAPRAISSDSPERPALPATPIGGGPAPAALPDKGAGHGPATAREMPPAASGAGSPGSRPVAGSASDSQGADSLRATNQDDAAAESDAHEPASLGDILDEDAHLDSAQAGDAQDGAGVGDASDDSETDDQTQAAQGDEEDPPGGSDNEQLQAAPSQQDAVQPGVALPESPLPGSAVAGSEPDPLFPTSPIIERQKAFWIKIFTQYNSHQGLLHDGRIALPVYEAIDLTGMHYRAQKRYILRHKRQIIAGLHRLAASLENGSPLDADEQRLLALLPAGVQPRDVRGYAGNVRFQRGLADRFQAGVVRSGRLLAEMRRILKANDVPEDLAYLPHVESSFDNRTLSRFGAAGIWQFTRGTGREFLKVGYEVDERLDPLRATEAAAQFLRNNYELLGNWPLAITAYNHGPQSLARITKHMGTTELGALIQRYNGRLFKFASKNFYAEFLAAREVATHITDYFSDVEPDPPLEFNTVALPFFLDADKAAAALGVKEEALRVLNPALRKSVWSGAKLIPAGYVLRIPPDVEPKAFIGALPAGAQQLKQKPTTFVVVARGDSLYSIGRRIGVPWQEIASANNLSSYRRLLPGQRLIIPGKGYQPPPAPAPKLEVAVNAPPQAESAEAPQAAPLASEPSAGPLDGTTTPEAPPGVPTALVQGDGQAPVKDGLDQAELLQDLKLREVDAQRRTGLLVASYGETLGYYADWAGVDVQDIRALNGMSSRSSLQPGRSLRIPLDNVSPEDFNQRRLDFHQTRVESFYSEYNITDKVKIRVQRGQSSWAIAQNNNVPMWLFYRENPQLLTEPIRPGMQLTLPIVQQSEQN